MVGSGQFSRHMDSDHDSKIRGFTVGFMVVPGIVKLEENARVNKRHLARNIE